MLRSLSISNFRGFRKVSVDPLDRFNLILGKNNVGKTAFLEAVFLLAGPSNPELPLRVNIFRGFEQVRMNADEMWGWLFHKKDLKAKIKIAAALDNNRARNLEISLMEPKEYRNSGRKKAVPTDLLTTGTTTTGSPPDLMMLYHSESGKVVKTRAHMKEGGLAYEREKQIHLPNSIYMIARSGYSMENPERFSKLEEVGEHEQLLTPMKLIEPRLKRLAVLVTGTGPVIHGDIGIGRMLPVPMMGEGTGKLLTILLSIASAKDGLLLIDEIETGLHYEALPLVWDAIAEAGRKNNVQILATTHSWECLKAAHESFNKGSVYDFRLHRLDRFNQEVESQTYDRKKLSLAIEEGLELR